MRCNNCGFNNPPKRMKCEKCNAPLQGSMVDNDQRGNVPPPTENLARTIKGQQLKTDPWDCPKCGRPLIPGAGACNHCGHVLDTGKTVPAGGQAPEQDNKEYRLPPKPEETFRKKGIDPKKTILPDMGFILTPIASKYDKSELPEVKVRPMGEEVVVGREDLEPDNGTISGEQAKFVNMKGKWYVKNISEHKTTYIYAGEFIEVQDGDIIRLGNREFVFST